MVQNSVIVQTPILFPVTLTDDEKREFLASCGPTKLINGTPANEYMQNLDGVTIAFARRMIRASGMESRLVINAVKYAVGRTDSRLLQTILIIMEHLYLQGESQVIDTNNFFLAVDGALKDSACSVCEPVTTCEQLASITAYVWFATSMRPLGFTYTLRDVDDKPYAILLKDPRLSRLICMYPQHLASITNYIMERGAASRRAGLATELTEYLESAHLGSPVLNQGWL